MIQVGLDLLKGFHSYQSSNRGVHFAQYFRSSIAAKTTPKTKSYTAANMVQHALSPN